MALFPLLWLVGFLCFLLNKQTQEISKGITSFEKDKLKFKNQNVLTKLKVHEDPIESLW